MTVTRELAERHYAEHAQRPFFGELVEFITSGPIAAMVLEGPDAVKAARQLIGATNPLEAAPGSIRGDLAIETATTWSTARTRRSRRRARRRCSSRTWPSCPSGWRWCSLRARPSGAPCSHRLDVDFTVRLPDVPELERGRSPAAWRSRTRCARRVRARVRGARGRARLRHDRRRSTASSTASRATQRRRGGR